MYTGLTKILGKPREFEKNLEDTSYFEKEEVDISIPVDETSEFAKVNHKHLMVSHLTPLFLI